MNKFIKHYHMLPAIKACVPAGVTFKSFAWWQYAWIYAIVWGGHRQVALVTCRNISKTFTTMFAVVMKCVLRRGTLVSWVPGGNQKQNVQARSYFTELVIYSDLKNERGSKWDENEKLFKNTSRLMFLAPTPESVHSQRATDLVFDECQDMVQEVFAEAAGQAFMGTPLKIFIGVSESGTQMEVAFKSPTTSFKMELDSEIGISSGILSRVAIDDAINSGMLTEEQVDVLIHCRWVSKSDRCLQPTIIYKHELPPFVEPVGWGVDFNGKKVQHWAVLVGRDRAGNVYSLVERNMKEYASLLALPHALFPEDDGFNTGFVEALQRENREKNVGKIISPKTWRGDEKSEGMGEIMRMQEHGKLFVVQDGCPQLARDVSSIPFNSKGYPDKELAEKLLLNPHVVDAAIIGWLKAGHSFKTSVYGNTGV